jgi:hypothetical protein
LLKNSNYFFEMDYQMSLAQNDFENFGELYIEKFGLKKVTETAGFTGLRPGKIGLKKQVIHRGNPVNPQNPVNPVSVLYVRPAV